MMAIYDKTGREIRVGDTLKIFHFIGSRRKKYFMYKQVIDYKEYTTHKLFTVSHLDTKNSVYYLADNEKFYNDIEIVQGYNNKNGELSFEDRPRIIKQNSELLEIE